MNNINNIICGDCIDVLKTIDESSVDLIVTSPPYNIGIKYDGYSDNREWSDYYKWCEQWINECYRTLKPDGRMVLNHYLSLGNSSHRESPISELNNIAINIIGFKHHSIAVWQDITLSNRTAWGSFMSASAPYINAPFEGVLILFKERWKKDKKGTSDISKEDFIKLTRGRWEIKTEIRGKTPCAFSEHFASSCIKLLSYVNDVVLDPFSGSGTTAAVCKRLSRKYIAIDQSETYCKIARERLSQESLNFF